MKCLECGNELKTDDKFCEKCGASIKSEKKSIHVSRWVIITISVAIIIVACFLIYSLFINKKNVENTNVSELENSTINYKGLGFSIPTQYDSEMDPQKDKLVIKNKQETWIMSIDVVNGSYDKGLLNIDKIKSSYIENGISVEEIEEKEIGNRKYIVAKINKLGETTSVAYTQATPDKVVIIYLVSEEAEYDTEKLNVFSSILDFTTYKDESNKTNIEVDSKFELNNLEEIFN